jgi:hypothetical protein
MPRSVRGLRNLGQQNLPQIPCSRQSVRHSAGNWVIAMYFNDGCVDNPTRPDHHGDPWSQQDHQDNQQESIDTELHDHLLGLAKGTISSSLVMKHHSC